MSNTAVREQEWGKFIKLLLKSKLPWKWYMMTVIAGIIMSTAIVKLPQLAGQVMQGQIFDKQLVTQFIVLTVVTTLLKAAVNIFTSWVNLNTDRNLEKSIWKKLIRMPMKFINSLNPSSLTSRVTSDAISVSQALSQFFALFYVTYTLVLTLITIYGMNSKMFIAMFAIIPWVLLVTILPGRFMFRAQNKIQSRYSEFTNFVSERLANLRLIKSASSEKHEVQKGFATAEDQYKSELYLAKVNLIVQPFIFSTQGVCMAITLIYGGVLVNRNELEMGQLITLVIYSQVIPAMISQYILCYQEIKRAQGATNKISEIMESDSEKVEGKISFALPDDDIVFNKVSFSYGRENVLSDLSFVIPKGKVTAIIGPSGSGKSTILNILERFYEPKSGKITFGNVPVEDIHLDEWRSAIGYVPQNSPLLSGSIWDNIVYGLDREVNEEEVIRAAEQANIYEYIKKLPAGFHTKIGELGSKLSGGQKQRIAIARTIITNPDYLLLDEATCSLDPQNEHEVQKALNNLMQGRTTVVVAHNIKTIANADNIIVLDQGKVTATGKHDQLYTENSLYRKYFDLQFH
ncbi:MULTISPECIES: ABC transporter ATP-binding protein [Paenibacillus]|uniref:ATP-binding cassette subfamily B protein AbcA/BmrA n=1 Tax=Paenibacillus pabuli TaxID=1472 RepID=A0A855XPS8_9BACL|nr:MULTISPECIES: ABC transporter ATP-binding protein [Paenibacillus]PWW32690.1 ATP-binding cassette subfamily B protein AbcA/BmrA [Paenibacillus pabuli]PXV98361.1 ATP-binding cassette subfamily B protein AbcA/BmrA [Paenibacillus taichungensis]